MDVGKLLIGAVVLIVVFFVTLNSTMLADQADKWVQANPSDPAAPKVLYYAARWCDILGDNNKAIATYMELYNLYPDASDYCAPALFHCAQIQATTTSAPKLANNYLQIIFDHYASEDGWDDKAKQLSEEVNHVR